MSAVLDCECEGCGAACDGDALVTVAGVSAVLCDPCLDEVIHRTRRPWAGPYERDRALAAEAGVPCHGEIA